MLGTKFNMFCSPHPNGIWIRDARFIVLGPRISPVGNDRQNANRFSNERARFIRTDCSDLDEFGIGYNVGGDVQSYVLFERRFFPEVDEERFILVDRFTFRL